MSSVTYHGEYPDGQLDDEGEPFIIQQGYKFTPGKPVKVDNDFDLLALTQNRFFKTPDSDKEELKRAQDEAEKAEVASLQSWLDDHQVPHHHRLGSAKLRELKADYLLKQAQAEEG